MSGHCRGCGVAFPQDGGSGKFGFCLACREFNPSRRRLTEAEWEAELARARPHGPVNVEDYGARGDGVTDDSAAVNAAIHAASARQLRTRTGRRRSWWQRGWKR